MCAQPWPTYFIQERTGQPPPGACSSCSVQTPNKYQNLNSRSRKAHPFSMGSSVQLTPLVLVWGAQVLWFQRADQHPLSFPPGSTASCSIMSLCSQKSPLQDSSVIPLIELLPAPMSSLSLFSLLLCVQTPSKPSSKVDLSVTGLPLLAVDLLPMDHTKYLCLPHSVTNSRHQ